MNSEFRRWEIVLLLWRRVRFRRTNLRMITRDSNSCKRWAGVRVRASELLLKELSTPSESKQIKTYDTISWFVGLLCFYHNQPLSSSSSLFDVCNEFRSGSGGDRIGLGANTGVADEDDDEFDTYRKRMMLSYRFRPNPMNNPRRQYYWMKWFDIQWCNQR